MPSFYLELLSHLTRRQTIPMVDDVAWGNGKYHPGIMIPLPIFLRAKTTPMMRLVVS